MGGWPTHQRYRDKLDIGKTVVFTVTFDLTNRLSYSLVKTLVMLENELTYSPSSPKTHDVVKHTI